MNNKKFVIMLVALILSVCCTISVSLAWLVSLSDPVINTFTVGNVSIDLDESKVTLLGEIDGNDRVKTNEYKLIPGHTYTKDPTVTVNTGSEDCWVFVKIENALKLIIVDTTIENQMLANNWKCIDEANQIYAYNKICSAGEEIATFTSFKIANDANVAEYVTTKDAEGNITNDNVIKVTAYAIQSDGFTTAEAAWAAAPTDWNNNN